MSHCPLCGATEEAGPLEGGPCWACLRRFAGQQPTTLGEYTLVDPEQPIGRGASSIVHLAEHSVSGELVALKLAKPGTPPELFRRQARIEGTLRHRNIVSARLGPEHEGRPSLVMPFIDGGKLSRHALRLAPLEQRLELVVKIAHAVHAANVRGVVYCDLKPDNILIDSNGEPHLCDFAVAAIAPSAGESVPIGGTVGWMSPEQARLCRRPELARDEPLTPASDVFALGILLYWLVTGRLPFGKGDAFYDRVTTEGPPPLPRYGPDLGWGMLAVAHQAMRRVPNERYSSSAAALAKDLEFLRHYQPTSFPVPTAGRVFRLAKRNPGTRDAVLFLLPVIAFVLAIVTRQQQEDLKKAVLGMNAYAASGQAATVLFQLRDYAEVVKRAASAPELSTLVVPARPLELDATGRPLERQNPCRHQTVLADPAPLRPFAAGFSTMMALDSSGCARARVSEEEPSLEFIQRHLATRDYFAGAEHDAKLPERSTWVRKAYRSTVTQQVKFAVSTPLFAPAAGHQEFIGVVAGSVTVASTLGLANGRPDPRRDQITVVVGPFDPDPRLEARARPDEYTVLSHPKLGRGNKVNLDSELGRRLAAAFKTAAKAQFELPRTAPITREDYEDPIFHDRWLAAFAPVGGTGYVVVVQTRADFAARPVLLLQNIAVGLAATSVLLIGGWVGLWLWGARAKSRTYGNDRGSDASGSRRRPHERPSDPSSTAGNM